MGACNGQGGGNPDNMFPSMRERDFHRWETTPAGGRMRNGLVRVGFALTDQLSESDGGFCCIPGRCAVPRMHQSRVQTRW